LEFAEDSRYGGGALFNAGAYGSEFERWSRGGRDERAGRDSSISREQMNFSYRDSHLPAGTVVTRVRLRLAKPSRCASIPSCELVSRKKQPTCQAAQFSSMFRNPPGDYAGRRSSRRSQERIGQRRLPSATPIYHQQARQGEVRH
jgi:UDP-N-acetylenolpyruvoylglucosamine reductase